jgi:hypothetical protein
MVVGPRRRGKESRPLLCRMHAIDARKRVAVDLARIF